MLSDLRHSLRFRFVISAERPAGSATSSDVFRYPSSKNATRMQAPWPWVDGVRSPIPSSRSPGQFAVSFHQEWEGHSETAEAMKDWMPGRLHDRCGSASTMATLVRWLTADSKQRSSVNGTSAQGYRRRNVSPSPYAPKPALRAVLEGLEKVSKLGPAQKGRPLFTVQYS